MRYASKESGVLTLAEIDRTTLAALLGCYGLTIEEVDNALPIPGSYWGETEAGLMADTLYVRADTPVHSVLHEACHYICMDTDRRASLDTDAGGTFAEEDAVCYLQVVLSGYLAAVGRERMLLDMDAWGYTFRLGSARAWFEDDSDDAFAWLLEYGLVNSAGRPTWCRREGSDTTDPCENLPPGGK